MRDFLLPLIYHIICRFLNYFSISFWISIAIPFGFLLTPELNNNETCLFFLCNRWYSHETKQYWIYENSIGFEFTKQKQIWNHVRWTNMSMFNGMSLIFKQKFNFNLFWMTKWTILTKRRLSWSNRMVFAIIRENLAHCMILRDLYLMHECMCAYILDESLCVSSTV